MPAFSATAATIFDLVIGFAIEFNPPQGRVGCERSAFGPVRFRVKRGPI
jgi:hypothetical protein